MRVGDAVLRRFGDTVRADAPPRRPRRPDRRRGIRAAPAGHGPRRRARDRRSGAGRVRGGLRGSSTARRSPRPSAPASTTAHRDSTRAIDADRRRRGRSTRPRRAAGTGSSGRRPKNGRDGKAISTASPEAPPRLETCLRRLQGESASIRPSPPEDPRRLRDRGLDRQRMNAAGEFSGEGGVDHAVGLDPRLAGEGVGGDLHAKVGLALGPMAGVTLVKVRLIDHIELRRMECLAKRLGYPFLPPSSFVSVLSSIVDGCVHPRLVGRVRHDHNRRDEPELQILRPHPHPSRQRGGRRPRKRRAASGRAATSAGGYRAPKGRHREGAVPQLLPRPRARVQQVLQLLRRACATTTSSPTSARRRPATARPGTWGSARMAAAAGKPQRLERGLRRPVRVLRRQRRRSRAASRRSRGAPSAISRSARSTRSISTGTESGTEIKARYKELVKRLHPDANGGDRSLEDRLREIIQAYHYLKSAGFC